MADCIHAAVHAVEVARLDAAGYGAFGDSGRNQLGK
jgi:hypothetical protein